MGSLIEYFGYILIIFSVPLYLLIKLVQKQIATYRASIKAGSSKKIIIMNRIKTILAKLLFYFVFFIFCGALIPPGCLRDRAGGQLTACLSNLKNMGTVLEMYMTKYKVYPDSLERLVPKYLRFLPTCPASGKASYIYTTGNSAEDYTIYCEGDGHRWRGVPRNYPQYTSKKGLDIGK